LLEIYIVVHIPNIVSIVIKPVNPGVEEIVITNIYYKYLLDIPILECHSNDNNDDFVENKNESEIIIIYSQQEDKLDSNNSRNIIALVIVEKEEDNENQEHNGTKISNKYNTFDCTQAFTNKNHKSNWLLTKKAVECTKKTCIATKNEIYPAVQDIDMKRNQRVDILLNNKKNAFTKEINTEGNNKHDWIIIGTKILLDNTKEEKQSQQECYNIEKELITVRKVIHADL